MYLDVLDKSFQALGDPFVVVPWVSLLTKNKSEEQKRVEEIFACYNEE